MAVCQTDPAEITLACCCYKGRGMPKLPAFTSLWTVQQHHGGQGTPQVAPMCSEAASSGQPGEPNAAHLALHLGCRGLGGKGLLLQHHLPGSQLLLLPHALNCSQVNVAGERGSRSGGGTSCCLQRHSVGSAMRCSVEVQAFSIWQKPLSAW